MLITVAFHFALVWNVGFSPVLKTRWNVLAKVFCCSFSFGVSYRIVRFSPINCTTIFTFVRNVCMIYSFNDTYISV